MRITSKNDGQRRVEAGSQCVEAEQKQYKNINIFNSLADVIHKNVRNAAGNRDKVVHSWFRRYSGSHTKSARWEWTSNNRKPSGKSDTKSWQDSTKHISTFAADKSRTFFRNVQK